MKVRPRRTARSREDGILASEALPAVVL